MSAEPAPAPAAAEPTAAVVLDETDPQAVALGYVADASRVDTAKHPNFVAGSRCDNCSLYQGQAGAESGACPIYGGKLVASAGWCSAWAKKA
jgi:hypothetical protein